MNQARLATVFVLMHVVTCAVADVSLFAEQQPESLFVIRFHHQSNQYNEFTQPVVDTDVIRNNHLLRGDHSQILNTVRFNQYDATLAYPFGNQYYNVDLGVTLRHLRGQYRAMESEINHFNTVLPVLHATALFNLPLSGFTAGIEGSHLNYDNSRIFDYRAKLSYEWRKGFGLQGGWQHQQFNLDQNSDNATDYEVNGPFIDFYLNF